MKFKLNAIITAVALTLSIGTAAAFELKVPKLGDSSSSSGIDVNSLTKQQDTLIKSLSSALRDLTQSQAIMANALGLKAQASLAESNANKLKNGDLTGKDDADKVVSSTLEVNKAIQDELKKGTKLSEESKAQFITSLPFYGKGAVGTVVTGKQAAEAAKALTTTTDLTILSKVGTLIYIAKQAPSLLSTFSTSTGQVLSFAKVNGVETKALEDLKWE